MEYVNGIEIKEYERLDDLQLGGLRIIQNPQWFCFGIDAVLLSNFADISKSKNIVEFGTGTGIIPILLAGKNNGSHIRAFEVQPEVGEMANRSIELNGLGDRIEIIVDNLENASKHIEKSSVDVVITNPPYFKANGGIRSSHSSKAIARHEVLCDMESVISSACSILKPGGAFYMVHRPDRLVDIVWHMKKVKLEPKEIRFVQPKAGQAPNIILVKGVRGAGPELRFMDPLVVYNDDGTFTDEIFKIYKDERIDSFER